MTEIFQVETNLDDQLNAFQASNHIEIGMGSGKPSRLMQS